MKLEPSQPITPTPGRLFFLPIRIFLAFGDKGQKLKREREGARERKEKEITVSIWQRGDRDGPGVEK